MKLQLALDDIPLAAALALVEDVRAYIDIIEVGTPFLYAEGLAAVRELRRRFPEKEILADLKIMDAGEYETRQALAAGADYVTVLGVTDILTVKGCLAVAAEFGKTIVVDMICEPDLAARIKQLEAVGVRALALMPLPTEKRNEGQRDGVVQLQGVAVRPGEWLYADADGLVVSTTSLH